MNRFEHALREKTVRPTNILKALIRIPFFVAAPTLLFTGALAHAQNFRGSLQYASAQKCTSDKKLTADQCANAEANARAEFDEKAPRFPSRETCERMFGAGKCSVGFGGIDGGKGKSRDMHFSPRFELFAVKAVSDRDITVTPIVNALTLSPRTVLRRDTHINPALAIQARKNIQPPATRTGGYDASGAQFGVSRPDGPTGPVPLKPAVDPNFDCAAVLEPGTKGDGGPGCVIAPHRGR
jgi:hypothetical protein